MRSGAARGAGATGGETPSILLFLVDALDEHVPQILVLLALVALVPLSPAMAASLRLVVLL